MSTRIFPNPSAHGHQKTAHTLNKSGRVHGVWIWYLGSPDDHARWPPIGADDPGLAWTELTVSFTMTTGIPLPIRLPHGGGTADAIDPLDPRIQVLPKNKEP